jgi:hypothetical protein
MVKSVKSLSPGTQEVATHEYEEHCTTIQLNGDQNTHMGGKAKKKVNLRHASRFITNAIRGPNNLCVVLYEFIKLFCLE